MSAPIITPYYRTSDYRHRGLSCEGVTHVGPKASERSKTGMLTTAVEELRSLAASLYGQHLCQRVITG
jgi:hypothetical protein